MRRRMRGPWLTYLATAVVAIGLKAHYRGATVSALAWILEPTATVVGWVLHQPLSQDRQLGWLPPDHSFVIAPACAGVNFLILVFAVSVLGCAHRLPSAPQRGASLITGLGAAYVVTIVVNSLRIVIAVTLYHAQVHTGWLTAERLHRVAGTGVYLGGLWGTWTALDHLSARRRPHPASSAWASVLLPLGVYIAMTVVVPLANGAWGRYGVHYLEHAVTVSLIVAATLLLHSLVRWATSGPIPRGQIGSFVPRGRRGGRHAQTDDSGGRGRAGDC